MINIIIGNAVSVIAAVFSVLSSSSHGTKKIYGYQMLQCITMAIASIFLSSPAGFTTFVLCALRNYFLSRDKLTGKLCIIFVTLTTLIGVIANTRGLPGLLPVITTVIYTIGTYLLKGDHKIKLNIIVNLILWGIYDIFVLDFISFIMDSITVIVTLISMIQAHKHYNRQNN